MDYKKKYDEALNDMRAIYPNLKGDAKLAVEHAFPELRESEDERIREKIKKCIIYDCSLTQEETDDMLAYLEKQKEQKPKIIIPKFRIGEYIKPKPYNEKHLIKNINENGYVLDVDFVIPFKDEDVWEVVEQKPAEWGEEDETALGDLMWCIEQARKSAKDENDMGNIWFAENWVKNRLKSLRPQPKRSDTYYDIIHNILDMLKGMDFMKITPEHRVSLLNDIRVKCKNADECAAILDEPSWKPSKDEERLINTSISFLKDFADKGYENAVECIDWLKSKLNGNSGK